MSKKGILYSILAVSRDPGHSMEHYYNDQWSSRTIFYGMKTAERLGFLEITRGEGPRWNITTVRPTETGLKMAEGIENALGRLRI